MERPKVLASLIFGSSYFWGKRIITIQIDLFSARTNNYNKNLD